MCLGKTSFSLLLLLCIVYDLIRRANPPVSRLLVDIMQGFNDNARIPNATP